MLKDKKKKKKGQSTLEYIVLVTAVVAVILVFMKPGGIFQSRVNATLDTVTNTMTNMAGRLSTAQPLSP